MHLILTAGLSVKGVIMDFKDIWNNTCYVITNKSQNASEREFQILVESLFEKLGWSQYKGEIITQKAIPVGASNSIKPDIIIKNNVDTLFVVELKKPNIQMSERNTEQLFSYMRLLKLNLGILIGESLQVYWDLPNDNKPPVKIVDITFNKESDKGIHFIELLSKDEYSFENLQNYCKEQLAKQEKKEIAQKYVHLLCSEEGTKIIIDLLKEKISNDYSEEITSFILNEINIHIIRKGMPVNTKLQDNDRGISPIGDVEVNGLTPSQAKSLCRKNGINLNGKVTFASKNSTQYNYWANPKTKFLESNWWLLLNDWIHGKLHVFNIPANSIKIEEVKIRGNLSKIDLQIIYENDSFEDSRSGIQFIKWFVKTISY
jgi:hypothetical protein